MRVLISGYYGFGNLGDEMLLDALRDLLFSVGVPREEIFVLSSSPKATSLEHGLPSLKRGDFFKLIKLLGNGDLLISGPGGLFQDITGPLTPAFYASHILLARLRNAKVWVYGQSLGPVKRRFNLFLVKFALRRAELVTLRDEGMSYLAPKGRLCFTPDPAFSLGGSALSSSREGVCFVFRAWKWTPESFIESLLSCGFSITLVSFQPSKERELGLRLSRKYGLPFLEINEWKEACELFSSFKVIVGMRLHSLVVSALTSTPFVGLSYDPKVRSLCRLLEMPCVDLSEGAGALCRYTNDLMVKWNEISGELERKVERLRVRVKAVFKECWNLLWEGGSART